MQNAYAGKILKVDLSGGKTEDIPLPAEDILRKYLGCWGLAMRFLYDILPPGYEPTDPENPLIYMTGPLTGLHVPCANNLTLTTKSFDTGLTGRAHTHGSFGPWLKFAGYDGLIVTGIASAPVYLWIHDGKVDIRDASHLWGKDTHETEDLVREELGEPKASVAAIGPAGENLCAGALIANDRNHSLAHGGGGVMGAKKLKAIAVFSKERPIRVFDGARLKEISKRWQAILESPNGYKERLGGGAIARTDYQVVQKLTGVAAYNWRRPLPEFGKGMSQNKISPPTGKCWRCPIQCAYDVEVTSGPHKGCVATLCGGGEALEGSAGILGITEPGTVFYLTDLYDRLGAEGSTVGCTIAMAVEAYEKGLISKEDTDGLELSWENPEVAEQLLRKYVNRDGFGDILARGPLEAAEIIGGEAPNFAIHAKGAGIPLHDWRHMWGKLLSIFVTSVSGHAAHAADTISEPDAGYPEKTYGPTRWGKAEEVYRTGPHKWYQDSIGTCWFACSALPGMAELVSEALSAATGWDYTKEELLKAGERSSQLERVFNVRHGLRPEDDLCVGPRILEAPTWGLAEGKALGPYLKGMVKEYYKMMGWDWHTGKPVRRVLKALDLEKEACDLWGEG
ncbi:aldehyde ferredoxin oxidoreductase family protein [Chloroflexota bacterium]